MILYIDTKIIQKLNKATPFRSVFPIPSIKNIFQEIYTVSYTHLTLPTILLV